jgi:hypothetical protein
MSKINNPRSNSPESDKKNRVYNFFNSPFGLWLLSTIFIGLITFSYENWRQFTKSRYEKDLQVNNLEIEINRRIYIFNKELNELSKMDTLTEMEKEDIKYPKKLETAIRKINNKNCYVFEQFRKRKLSSLLYELYVLLPTENKSIAEDAFEKMFLIEQFPSLINKNTSSEVADRYFEKILEYTRTSLSLDKWNNK